MTIGPVLVTGGTGKVGRRLATRLRERGVDVQRASRRPCQLGDVHFDWRDPSTWANAVHGALAVYLVAPAGGDPAAPMIDFCRVALDCGVSRLVLQSASLLDADGPGMGQVHAWLIDHAPDWVVLRPSWFMDNLVEGPLGELIRHERAVESAAGQGRIPLIAADDIAAVAAEVLTGASALTDDFVLTGPEAHTYDEVATFIGHALGEPVIHRHLTMEQLSERHQARGLERAHAETLAFMDLLIASGAENRTTTAVHHIIGRAPTTLDQFIARSAAAWRR
jgi:uncharacterized protein YbjT (DUF2867 family)